MIKSLMTILVVAAVSLGLALVAGCESDAQTGAAVGALAGAGIGQLAGGDTEATLIGAAVGGGAGYMLGNEQDKKKAADDRESIRQEMNTVMVKVVGPRGEYYENLPTEDQLRPVYGF
ncbi:MAG: glycine zipper domain-containing protein [Planctomycetota bacterium]|jgi:hypothetical protein